MAQTYRLAVTVDGRACHADVQPCTLLVDFLRNHLSLTGVRTDCADGACGTCTVLVDGRSVRSCITFAVQVDGTDVRSVDGLVGDTDLRPFPDEWCAEKGLWCGDCTPWMRRRRCAAGCMR
jgi:aerobic-type carbon monoxide dehydrogenase small subunit (CoxS/CutS family)